MIAFDADDTLWHNEPHFLHTHEKFTELLSNYHDPEWIERRLIETEIRNLKHFGYGVKGFTLSMIETAIDLTEGRVGGEEISRIIEFGKSMIGAPLELLKGVRQVVEHLGGHQDIMIITKGDLFDQEAKIARSGLADLFKHIEIVSEKNPETYRSILERYDIAPERFLMIGNSLKSDVLPILALDGHAIHIPYQTTWEHEQVSEDVLEGQEIRTLKNMAQLPEVLVREFGLALPDNQSP